MQKKNPLEGITLERMLTELVECYGWEKLASEITLNCFARDPSIPSSLKFLRRTPWARNKVEVFYLVHLDDLARAAAAADGSKGKG